jgi:mannose-6-phosphate isomerase
VRSKVILSGNLKQTKIERIEKPWGYELIWAHTAHYVAKILFVKAGHSLSLQYHVQKEETMFVESGECLIESGTDPKQLSSQVFSHGDVFHIQPGRLHRIHAKTDCRIFEVSTPHLNDVVRIEDKYGRTS